MKQRTTSQEGLLDSKRSMDSAVQMSGGQTERVQNLSNHPGLLESSDDFQFATAVRAVFDVDIDDPFQQSGPADANRRRGMGRAVLRGRQTPMQPVTHFPVGTTDVKAGVKPTAPWQEQLLVSTWTGKDP